jgi:hypothetical protein
VKHFRPYLYGRKFKIANDYKPVMWIMSIKRPEIDTTVEEYKVRRI